MGSLSIWHLILVAVELWLVVIFWVSAVRILNRAGFSGWWSLLILLPIVNVIALWRFSKARWPTIDSGVGPS